jgi:putative SOS response-associated peptidase YedK
MCSRYALTSNIEAVRRMFRLPADGLAAREMPPRWNIAPTQPIAVVRLKPGIEALGERELALVRWGLVPHWVKDPRTLSTMLNARAETVLEKASFKIPMRHRRCLVPADAFYEWSGERGAKTPYLIRPREKSALVAPMAFAALWEHWLGADGSEVETAAIITTTASEDVRTIHERMPVIVPPRHFAAWLDVRGTGAVEAAGLLEPAPAGLLDVILISTRVNNPAHDDADVQTPAGS